MGRSVNSRCAALLLVAGGWVSFPSWAHGGPYAPAAGQPGSDAIANSDPRIVDWASGVVNLTRGPQDINAPAGALASYGAASAALGPAEGDTTSVVSLGDGGSITLSFPHAIRNGRRRLRRVRERF